MSISKHIAGVSALQAVIFSVPLLGLLAFKGTVVPFPPLGGNSDSYCGFGMVIIAASAIVPYFVPKWLRRRFIVVVLFALSIGSGYLYLHLEGKKIVYLEDGTPVIKGDIRNPALSPGMAVEPIRDLIEDLGEGEDGLRKAFTLESLQANREAIFSTYLLTFVALQFCISLAVLTGKDHKASSSRSQNTVVPGNPSP